MTASPLPDALRACAAGIRTHEAGISLLIANRTFLGRDDFTSRFITRDTATRMAAIDWAAAITALNAGEIPCSGLLTTGCVFPVQRTRGVEVGYGPCSWSMTGSFRTWRV